MKMFKFSSLMIALAFAVVSVSAQKVEPMNIDQLTRNIEFHPKDTDAYLLQGCEYDRPGVEVPDQSRARLFDEFKFSYQGHLKMLMDGFFVELMNNPDAQGYLMIYPKSDRLHRQIERIVKEWMRVRRYDNSRLTLFRAPNNSPSMIQMWVVPAGAENPKPTLTNTEK